MLALVDIVTFIVLFTFLRFSLVAPGYSFSIFRGGILCRSSPQINFDFQSQLRRFKPVGHAVIFCQHPQGVFPIVVIDYHALEGRLKVSWIVIRSPGGADIRDVVQAAIDFGLKKHFSVAKRIVFAREKVFFVVQKIGFVTETIGLARSAIISVPVSIGFGLKKHFSVAKRIVFAGEKTFVVVQKIRFVTEMI